MTDVEFVRGYAARLPKELKTRIDKQIRDIVSGKKIAIEQMFDNDSLENIRLGYIEKFVYKFCRDNQRSFEPRACGTKEWN